MRKNNSYVKRSPVVGMLPPAIAICGLAGSGKTTVTKTLLANFEGVTRLPFAAPLKGMVESLGVSRDTLWGDDAAKSVKLSSLGGHTARHALQTLGTQWGRDCMGDTFWVNLWLAAAKKQGLRLERPVRNRPGEVRLCVVADDCRFQNEADAVRSVGGIVIRVHRKGAGATGKGAKAHASESNDFAADFDMDNNGTLVDVVHKLNVIFKAYNAPRPVNVDWGHSASYVLVD